MKGKVLDENSALRIKEAAREVFLEKGYDGATMQAIADRSGLTKALLHYYYRSKDRLFLLIFEEELRGFFGANLEKIRDPARGPRDKLLAWIDSEARIIAERPELPLFLITEFHRNPELIRSLVGRVELPEALRALRELDGSEGAVPRVAELLVSLFSLLVFPIAAGPLLGSFLELSPELIAILRDRQIALVKKSVDDYFQA